MSLGFAKAAAIPANRCKIFATEPFMVKMTLPADEQRYSATSFSPQSKSRIFPDNRESLPSRAAAWCDILLAIFLRLGDIVSTKGAFKRLNGIGKIIQGSE
jgi:hypothetical protein